jgi:tetratricopeptide (TPR) repeat protein
MLEDHPSVEDFEVFLRGTSRSRRHPRNPRMLRHLLHECAVCRDRLSAMGWSGTRLVRLIQPVSEREPQYTAALAYDYSAAFAAADRAVSEFLTPEPRDAKLSALLLAELDSGTASDRLRRVGEGGPFAAPGVVRSLIDRSHANRYKDADEMLHFAHLARVAAEACSPDGIDGIGGEMRLADLRTRAWGQYANALRLSGRLREAEEAFATAREHRQQGTGDPMLRAWLLERMTPLYIFQKLFKEAIEMCEEAGQVYQELGESHLLASTLIQKAIAILYSGEARHAARILNQAIPLIDNEEDPHLLLAACHNLICCYIDLDRPDQALMLYVEARELYQELDDPLILLRATRQEGQLLRDLGHLRAAETALLRARKGYQEKGLAYEMALTSLDLASVYVKLGLVEEVKRTVLTTVPIFHALRVKVETLAALLQLQQVADQEQQALELIRTLNTRVESLPKGKPLH